MACGPDPDRHVEATRGYLDVGFDEVDVNQIGPDQAGFFELFERKVRARL